MPQTRTIAFGHGHVEAALYPADGAFATFVFAHGAGANQSSDFMTTVAAGLATRGLHVLTFNFPYMQHGRKLPDPQPVLESCYRTVLEDAATDARLGGLPFFIGGKSMGGRMASHVAAARDADGAGASAWWPRLRGLVFFGYPLHPPARPQQVRVAHLPRITHSMLFVQGEKDAFGTPVELRGFIDVLPAPCTLHPVAHAGHSLDVPKRSGIAQEQVYRDVLDTVAAWTATQVRTDA